MRSLSLAAIIFMTSFTVFAADTALTLDKKFDACKSDIEFDFASLQSFSKTFKIEAMSKYADKAELAEIAKRTPTWNEMIRLGGSAKEFSIKINSMSSCKEVETYMNVLEEMVD